MACQYLQIGPTYGSLQHWEDTQRHTLVAMYWVNFVEADSCFPICIITATYWFRRLQPFELKLTGFKLLFSVAYDMQVQGLEKSNKICSCAALNTHQMIVLLNSRLENVTVTPDGTTTQFTLKSKSRRSSAGTDGCPPRIMTSCCNTMGSDPVQGRPPAKILRLLSITRSSISPVVLRNACMNQ